MLEVVDLEKSFERQVLKKITYEFEPGKVYVIKGVSGCGKSTLLNIIGGLDRDFTGNLKVDGKSLGEMNQKEFSEYRERVSYVFQNSLLISKLTVRENLLFIKDDENTIWRYAKIMGVSELLDKYPEQLSGGERQRIALMRAMLNQPRILIADEPTASLDHANSVKIAGLLRELTEDGCTTIIATHEDCFDAFADEIVQLDYGAIESVKKVPSKKVDCICKDTEDYEIQEHKKRSFCYFAFKRSKEKYKIHRLLPSILAFLSILAILSVQNNIQDWYMHRVTSEYPATMFSVTKEQWEQLKTKYEITQFEDYTYPLDGVGVYPLFDQKDSGLSYGNLIQYGRFPKTDAEVIVTQSYIQHCMHMDKKEEALGKSISLGKRSFKIVGILSNIDKGDQSSLFYSNSYYLDWNQTSIFVPYAALQEIGTKLDMPNKMVKLDNMYSSSHIYEAIRNDLEGPINEWDKKLMELQYLIDSIIGVIVTGVVILAFIAIIFIRNEVQLELYYRRKEIGYLQIFNVSQSKILHMIVWERSARSFISLLSALLVFGGVSIVIHVITGYSIRIPLFLLLPVVGIIAIYVIGITWIPCKRFLKKDVIELIV